MKNGAIFENSFRETVNSREINALGLKKTSSYYQTTSSKSYKKGRCRSLSFG